MTSAQQRADLQNQIWKIAQNAMHKQTTVNKIYGPAAGSGSLLLQAKKHFDAIVTEIEGAEIESCAMKRKLKIATENGKLI
jgi:type I restriction-modification system DNA methylase subunit